MYSSITHFETSGSMTYSENLGMPAPIYLPYFISVHMELTFHWHLPPRFTVLPQPDTKHWTPVDGQDLGREIVDTWELRMAGNFRLISMISLSAVSLLYLGWRIIFSASINCSPPSRTWGNSPLWICTDRTYTKEPSIPHIGGRSGYYLNCIDFTGLDALRRWYSELWA